MSSLRPTYAITSEQEELREAARVFATTELVELAAELERDNKPVPDEWRKRYEGDACNSANLVAYDFTPFSCRLAAAAAAVAAAAAAAAAATVGATQIRGDGLPRHQHTGGVWRPRLGTSSEFRKGT
eukprot:COSAG06_NODE_214_length_20125_cov_34.602467_6_plen_127_part_00